MAKRKKLAILQSNYIPWRGYFDLIAQVDEFILYDCVQYTRRDWRNRNRIKTSQGSCWLTIPIANKGRFKAKIRDMQISDAKWAERHWRTLRLHYAKSPCFSQYGDYFAGLYSSCRAKYLTEINRIFIESICELLGINTRLSTCDDYPVDEHLDRSERLAALCLSAGGTEYVSGESAKAYLHADVFADLGIQLSYTDYSAYPEYPQLFGPFVHQVSILDLIFNTGERAVDFMRHAGKS